MKPQEAALRRPGMMACKPYRAIISMRQCGINQSRELLACADCRTGARIRKEYPLIMRQAAARLKMLRPHDYQTIQRIIIASDIARTKERL